MIELSTDQQALQALAKALGSEADGKKLRRDLAKELRGALLPAVAEIRSGLMAIQHAGLPTVGLPLRATAAKKITAEARLTGKSTGARVRAKRTPTVRGFSDAPRQLNAAKGWRRRVFGKNIWVVQVGDPGYFDDPIKARHAELRKATLRAMNDAAGRISRKAKR